MRLQITFAKTEAMRYTGHLDLHHTLERTFRRAGLPVAYSQGYNPRPRLSLASALPLGITSQGEVLEVWLEEPLPLEDVQAALQASAPPGVTFLAVQPVAEGTPKLASRVRAAEYCARISNPPPDLEERLKALLAATDRPRQRKGKTYDLRPLIETLALAQTETPDQVDLLMRLAARPGATGRPDEVLSALRIPPEGVRIQRRRLILT